ncbi:hypothetical protein BH721_06840 [Clostridium baratii]|uniref:Uncharacterized protein n=1 Tax=Clostridium baratii TaxID=1561 RepID=A0A174UD49_9CLOT|nr:hypothetical protein [Clostridium baratii]OPF50802.1 hypothetical protein A1M12_08170 [Clostridium baratii]OPF54580.1 hypothetical protein BH721_06840 [Clostridium baratii]OPF54886.1 hypothetical protein BH724_01600 [Clostridium baratii]OPF59111.1 hypothetical protein BH725_10845 [Clostridium baratii]CUQ17928.1 Uncharacterised protein [Clostridium baratii]
MDWFLIIEIAFIILYSFAMVKNYFKRTQLKKDGHFVVIRNYNLSFIITLVLLLLIGLIYSFLVNEGSLLDKVLFIIIILILILNTYINSEILLTHGSFYYMYYNVPYTDIKSVIFKEKSKNSYLLKIEFEKTTFNVSINKSSADDFYEVLKDRKIHVERI